MARFLGRLLGDQDLPVVESRKDDAVVIRASGGSTYVPWGQPVANQWSMDRTIRQAYERVPWVWRTVDAIANRAASLRIRAITGETTDPDSIDFVDDHEKNILDLLNKRAAPAIHGMQGTAWAFRYRLSTILQLSKPGAFIEVVRKRGTGYYSLSLLPPQWTLPIPNPDYLVSSFQVWVPGAARYELPVFDPGASDTNSVIWLARPHPDNPFSGTIAMEAAGLSIEANLYGMLYNRNFMQNDGRPGGLVAIKGGLGQEDTEEVKRRFGGGIAGAGRTTVVEAEGLDWVDTATSPRDAQYSQTREQTKNDILEGMAGVPDTILGHAADRTYDNADAEREVFWTETMPDHLSMLERCYEVLTTGGYDDDVRLWHDTSHIEVLRRAYEKRTAQAQTEWDKGLITADEYRKNTGRDPMERPPSRVLWMPGMKFPVGAEADEKAAELYTVVYTRPVAGILPGQEGNASAGGAPPAPGTPKPAPTPKPAVPTVPQPAAASASPSAAVPAPGPGARSRGGLTVLPGGRKEFRNGDGQTGAMVALGPDAATITALTPYAEDPGSLHCTLAFLGQADAYDAADRQRAVEAVDRALDGVSTLAGTVSAVVPFDEDGALVWVALLDVPQLAEVRTDVVRALTKAGIEVSANHGFTAHITLTRAADPGNELAGTPVTLDTVIVAFGDEVDERPLDMSETKELEHGSAWV